MCYFVACLMKIHMKKVSVLRFTGYFTAIALLVVAGWSNATAQAIKLKSNSEKKLKVVFIGTNKKGEEVKRTLDWVDLGFWKTVSLYKSKYGYDLYNNGEMKEDGKDGTNRWKRMIVTDANTAATDELDLTRNEEEVKLPNNHLWVRMKKRADNDYYLTHISLYDHRKKHVTPVIFRD